MRPLLTHTWFVLFAIIPLLLAGWFTFKQVGSGFMPVMDEGGFILDYQARAGTSLTETDRLLRQVEDILAEIPAVDTYSRRTGLAIGRRRHRGQSKAISLCGSNPFPGLQLRRSWRRCGRKYYIWFRVLRSSSPN